MPRDSTRASRVADQIQRDLSDLIRLELKDPRIGLVTLTDVEVSRDLTHAKVYVSCLGDTASAERSVRSLQHAAAYLRRLLAKTLSLRTVPQLEFVYDASVEQGVRLSHLIDEAVVADAGRATKDGDAGE